MKDMCICVDHNISIRHRFDLMNTLVWFRYSARPGAVLPIPYSVESDDAWVDDLMQRFGLQRRGSIYVATRWQTERVRHIEDKNIAALYAMDDIIRHVEARTGKRAKLRLIEGDPYHGIAIPIRRKVWRWDAVLDGGTPVLMHDERTGRREAALDEQHNIIATAEIPFPYRMPVRIWIGYTFMRD